MTLSTPLNNSVLKVLSVILTNDEIKTLPTTPVVIASPSNAGIILVPISAIVDLNTVVPYTGVTRASVTLVNIDGDDLSGVIPLETYLISPFRYIFAFPITNARPGVGDFIGTLVSIPFSNDNPPLNGGIFIRDYFNGVSNYTGGDAANTMKITIHYMEVDVS